MAEFKIDVEALGKKCFDEFHRILLDEYGMTLDELARLVKAKQEGRLVEDVQGEWVLKHVGAGHYWE